MDLQKAEGADGCGNSLAPSGNDRLGGSIDDLSIPEKRLLAQLDEARDRIDVDTMLMRWQLDLLERIRRRRLIFELVDCTRDDRDDVLAKDIATFKRICRAHGWRPTP